MIKKSIFFLLIFIQLHAQKEANIWYFGLNAGLSFSSGLPLPLSNSVMSTFEGTATISDGNGNLLFYTDGRTIFNKNHEVLSNGTGLFGDVSSTQSSIIIPFPSSYNKPLTRYDKYIVVTSDWANGNKGVNYSVVDMNLDGGLGEVISKNNYLFGTTSTEKLCGVKHKNGCDYWLIAKPVGNVNYFSYLITGSGVNSTPVISNAGPVSQTSVGSLKSSVNNKLISVTQSDATPNKGVYVYDFDNQTGVLTLKFSDTTLTAIPYSQEFSIDGTKLYVSQLNSRDIIQYDLLVSSNADFVNSKQVIGTTNIPFDVNNYTACAMQMGIDSKIYISLSDTKTLAVINEPELSGVQCDFKDQAVTINPNGKVSLGLPNFLSNLFNQIAYKQTCVKIPTSFELIDNDGIISYNWSFFNVSDLTKPIATSTDSHPKIIFPTVGNYLAKVYIKYNCNLEYELTKDLIIEEGTLIQPTFDEIPPFCEGEIAPILSSTSLNGITGNWNPQVINNQLSSTYTFIPNSSECAYTTTLKTTVIPKKIPVNITTEESSIFIDNKNSGDFEYSLDEINWQKSNEFKNLSNGVYKIYIRQVDTISCPILPYQVIVFSLPNVITPQDDGKNDFWKVNGISQLDSVEVKIFDRYGKLIHLLKNPKADIIWDGKYLGYPVPSTSYWYSIQLNETLHQGWILIKNRD